MSQWEATADTSDEIIRVRMSIYLFFGYPYVVLCLIAALGLGGASLATGRTFQLGVVPIALRHIVVLFPEPAGFGDT